MIGLKYICLGGISGYAECANRNIAALAERGVPVSWHPMHYYGRRGGLVPMTEAEVGQHTLRRWLHQTIDYDTVLFHVIPHPRMRTWMDREAGRQRLLSTAWETDHLPADWPALLNSFERVIVPSAWNRQVCEASGVSVPVHVVPHFLPPAAPGPAALEPPLPENRCVFYTIGEWTHRKALGDLLKAYWRAFSAADPVLLVIKTTRLDMTLANYRRGWRRLWRWAGTTENTLRRLKVLEQARRPQRLAPVRLLSQDLPAPVMAALHARGNCYISLTHGEGWGLGAFEAASLGKPVIMTGWGGQLDFLPAEAAYHVPYRLVAAYDGALETRLPAGQRWARADLDQAAALMRRVAATPDEAQARGQALKAHIESNFSSAAIAARLWQALQG